MISRVFAAVIVALLYLGCSTAHAQVSVVQGCASPQHTHYRTQHSYHRGLNQWRSVWKGPPPRYTNPGYYEAMNERYPKFTGGFHSSYFHNMGIPTGDIGIRGNGIYRTPW